MEPVLAKIVEADKAARKLAEEAKTQRKQAQDEISGRKELIRKEYLARADERIEKLEKTRDEQTRQQVEDIKHKFEAQMVQLDKQYAADYEKWVRHIVSEVTEV